MAERTRKNEDAAREPWRPPSEPTPGVIGLPSTPRHPTEPVGSEDVPEGAEGSGTPAHTHTFPQYVNGWCLTVFILWHPVARAAPLTPRSHAAQLAGGGALHEPGPALTERVVAEVLAANEILKPCNIAFRVCKIVILDTTKATWGPAAAPKRLSDLMNDAGQILLPPEGSPDLQNPDRCFLKALEEIATNGGPADLAALLRQPCMHLFFVHDVEVNDNRREEGVGSAYPFGNGMMPMAIVDAQTLHPAQTIAHEFLHALGEDHSTTPGNLMLKVVDDDDLALDGGQCARINAFARRFLVPACPG